MNERKRMEEKGDEKMDRKIVIYICYKEGEKNWRFLFNFVEKRKQTKWMKEERREEGVGSKKISFRGTEWKKENERKGE